MELTVTTNTVAHASPASMTGTTMNFHCTPNHSCLIGVENRVVCLPNAETALTMLELSRTKK